MPDDRSWNDDDRPSWREIDNRRNRSSHRKEEPKERSGSPKQQAWVRTMARREADKLFKNKKSAEQAQAEQALAAAKGTEAFNDMARGFVEAYGVTDDRDVLMLLTEAASAEVAVPAVEALAAVVANAADSEKRVVVSHLKTLALTGKMKTKAAARVALASLE